MYDTPPIPLVSVIMPVYNAASFLRESIDSILNQSFNNFEFFIIDDASTDNSVEIIKSYADPRIQFISKPVNTGYTNSLNIGLQFATGNYIARMDADDISMPERIEEQVNYMEHNQDVLLCGTWFQLLGTDILIMHPVTHEDIGVGFLGQNVIGHSTVLFRNNIALKHNLFYNVQMEPAEDYDLWVKMYCIGKVHNIPKVLLHYRQHPEQISFKKSELQIEKCHLVKKQLLQKLYKDFKPKLNILSPPLFDKKTHTENKLLFQIFLSEIDSAIDINNYSRLFEINRFIKFCEAKRHDVVRSYFLKTNNFSFKKLSDFLFNRQKFYRHFMNKDKIRIVYKSLIKNSI